MGFKILTEEEKALIPNWTNREPFVVIEEMFRLPWRGKRSVEHARLMLSCAFCLKGTEPGDTRRWVMTPKGPNIFVCPEHDGDDVEERWAEKWLNEYKPILDRWGSE